MKKLSSILLCIIILAGLSSCKNNNVKTKPDNKISSETISQPEDLSSDSENPSSSGQFIPDSSNWEETMHSYIANAAMPDNATDDNYRTFYEVFVYTFYDSNNDGIGDINGLTNMLDYIQYMGFNGIWLMPIHPSPSYHKYDVTDYYAIDESYGTMEDFENFISECEKRNIDVIIDFVFNHTSNLHPWFQEAITALANGEESPYIDYYYFSKENPGDWHLAADDGENQWYYEGVFWSGMPDLNLENQDLRDELENIAQFWLDKGVQGFRLDAVKEFVSGSTEENVEILTWFNNAVKSYNQDAYIVGEAWINDLSLYEYYKSGVDSYFAFPFSASGGHIAKAAINNQLSAKDYVGKIIESQQHIESSNPNGISANFFTNHDSARAAGFMRRDAQLIKTAWGLNLMQPGNTFVYYGEEIAMSGSGKDENKRAPMFWSEFQDANGMCYGPPDMEKQEHSFDSAVMQIQDESSIMNYIRNAISIRNKYPQIARGSIENIDMETSSNALALVKRDYDAEHIYVLYNLGVENVQININSVPFTEILDCLCSTDEHAGIVGDTLEVPAYSILILQ